MATRTVHQTARDAWEAFCAVGGMEFQGRDEELEDAVRRRLDPLASSLDEALTGASTDALVRALLSEIAPFTAMFRSIIDFFARAGASHGRAQWEVRIDDEHLGLESLQRAIQTWDSLDRLTIPRIDFRGAWLLWGAAQDTSVRDFSVSGFHTGDAPRTGIADVDAWLRVYAENGVYSPFPASLAALAEGGGALGEAAAICWAAIDRARARWGNRAQLMRDYRTSVDGHRLLRCENDDALALGTIAQNETDWWLGSALTILGRARNASGAERGALETELQQSYQAYDRVELPMSADAALLQKILSLPVWHRRNELYAVWVATEIIAALPDHQVDIHMEDGKIVVAFKKAIIATITTALPVARLYAERYERLDSPVGKGRTDGVQPDYSLWSGNPEHEICRLVVEVKHHQRNARRVFSDALEDYARAHPQARAVLVSHGPVSDMLARVAASVTARCRLLGNLTAVARAQREALADEVRAAVGAPVLAAGGPFAILIDISQSMERVLASPAFAAWLRHPSQSGAQTVAFANNEIRRHRSVEEAVAEAGAVETGGSTQLEGPLADLLRSAESVLVATDEEGLMQIVQMPSTSVSSSRLSDGLVILLTSRAAAAEHDVENSLGSGD